jgi:hypothetical protein
MRRMGKLHSEEFHNFYSSPNNIRQNKSRMVEERKVYRVSVESPKERDHSEDRDVDGRMRSEWILGRLAEGVEWIQVAQDRDRRRPLINTVMQFGFWRHGVN